MCRCATLWHIWHSCWLAVASSCFLCHPVYLLLVVWILSSKESSSNADGSKSVGNSLHRSTSLSLTTLPHRSKSFQAKLHFGDMNDDIHVGVQCLRAIMNNQVHASPSFLVCTTSRCRMAYILLLWFFLSSFFFSTPNLRGHCTDLNQTWTHIYLWLLLGIYPHGLVAKSRFFGTDFEIWPNISLQWNIASIIGKKRDNLQGLPYMPPYNLVNFGSEMAENWPVCANTLNFRIGRHCQPYCMDII